MKLEYTERSFCLVVENPKKADAPPQILSFNKLTADISDATYKIKPHRVIVTLTKANPDKKWHTINDKGEPNNELV